MDERLPPDGAGAGAVPADGDEPVGTVGAMGPAVGATMEAVALAPGSGAPVLGGELVLDPPAATAGAGPEPVRTALVQAGPLAVAGLVTNGASVVVTILLARLLTTRGYGALNQLNGLFLVVSMPGSAVIVAVVRRVTSWAAAGERSRVSAWARRLHAQGTLAVAAFAVAAVAAGPWLAGQLGQPRSVGLDAMLAAGAVWVLLCLDRGLLQGHRSYRTLSANLLVEAGMRTVAVLAFVGLGGGVAGAASGILVAELVTAVHARVAADRAWPTSDGTRRRSVEVDRTIRTERRSLVTDLSAALLALATIAWLQNVDVIMIGREAPSIAGGYAAVSVASKALVFGAIVLGGYLLPEAAIRWREGSHALRQLGVTLSLLAVPGAVLLSAALGFRRLLLTVVFSSRYLVAQAAFVPLVVAMACLSVSVVLTMYLLAVGRRRVALLLLAGAAAATAAVAEAHGSAVGTARADLLVQAVLAAAIAAEFVLVHRRRLR